MKKKLFFVFAVYSLLAFGQETPVRLTVDSPNGRVTGRALYYADGSFVERPGLPDAVAVGQPMEVCVSALLGGYECENVTITCTTEANVTNVMEVTPEEGVVRIPADFVQGDIHIYAPFAATSDAMYLPVLTEEFDDEDGSVPDRTIWRNCDSWGSTWDRFVSTSRDVAFVSGGNLVCRAFVNPGRTTDKGAMISGAKESRYRFFFTHGYIEGRIKTTPHPGNFPAFWLMPEDQKEGWPSCGEIDIWETINGENRVYQTVHSYWIDRLHNWGTPSANGRNESCWQYDEWHTYGLLKEADKMIWYVDGEEVFSYSKSDDESHLSQGQWPFERAFYIILNQSVGDGSWASKYDLNFTYETLFDWVRVYQTPADAKFNGNNLLPTPVKSPVTIPAASTAPTYTLHGQRCSQIQPGNVYVSKGRKTLR